MFGLSRDFIQQDGISMLLGRADGLSAAELNGVQARMLMNTAIPHHLRLLLREIDLQVTLEYTVSRRKMLSHLLKSDKLSMSDLFGLLLQVSQGMDEGRLYMLRPEQYALHEDYIFIEGPLRGGKVYLTCIPLQQPAASASPGECMKSLIMVLMAAVTELAGSGVQRLLQYCGREDFSPAGLKGLLSELLTETHPVREQVNPEVAVPDQIKVPGSAAAQPAELGTQAKVNARTVPDLLIQPRRFLQERNVEAEAGSRVDAPGMMGYPKLKLKEEQPQPDLPDKENDAATPSSAYRTYIVLGGVLSDALLWKFLYLSNPKLLWLVVCLSLTLVLGSFCWLVWTERLVLGGRQEEDEAGLEDEAAGIGWRAHRELEWDFGRSPAASSAPSFRAEPVPSVQAPLELKPAFRQTDIGAAGRGLIKQPMAVAATALLPREDRLEKGEQVTGNTAPYLERNGEGEGGPPEKIELNRSSFIIGRSPEVAQYVEQSEGASRVHAEISKGTEGYIIKDLDSRNGTFYKGEAMIPYKEYPLAEGTIFTIVKGCYTFHSGQVPAGHA